MDTYTGRVLSIHFELEYLQSRCQCTTSLLLSKQSKASVPGMPLKHCWELSSPGSWSKAHKDLSILECRNAGERMMELSGIPASWAWLKALHFVYAIVIPSTSRDRSLVIHFGGVTLIYTAWGFGLYFPKNFPKFSNEKYQSGGISAGLGYLSEQAGECREPLSPVSPREALGEIPPSLQRGAGWGLKALMLLEFICWLSHPVEDCL